MDGLRPVTQMVKSLLIFAAQQLSYIKDLNKNMMNLEKKKNELTSREEDVCNEINRAKFQGKNSKNEVNDWLKNVQEVKDQVSDIEHELEQDKKCFGGCFPNYCSRRRLGKNALKMAAKVDELKAKGVFESGVAVDQLPTTARTLPTTTLVGKSTAEITLKQIWNCLKDKKIGRIGVHGMGGVGKTTIMKHINNQLKEDCLFDNIIWVTVSKDLSLKTIQGDVAKAIGLALHEDDDLNYRSAKVFEALMARKIVLILDDMWEPFSLEDIGLPEPCESNGSKLVLTTRSLRVCKGMETEREIKVEVLSEKEAWVLFQDKVGGNAIVSSQVQDIAKLVCKECGGLPLALITVGRALRKVKDVREWRSALNDLRRSQAKINGMQDIVFCHLRFSYDRLSTEKVRACFLYCSLFPEDFLIPKEQLIEYWILEGLIDELGSKQEEVDNGHAILNELTDTCMLESVNNILKYEYVKMHDLIRDMAINLTRESPCFMVRAGIGLKKLPNIEKWKEEVLRISLMHNQIEELAGRPRCPKLSTLLLQGNHLRNVENSFFNHMHSLKILDLSRTTIIKLPESISNMVNLRALIIPCHCLKEVPSLAKLRELRMLNLSRTLIREVPQGMEELINLRFLNLSNTRMLRVFPDRLMAKFSLLEDLRMDESNWSWPSNLKNRDLADICEILSLTRLCNISIRIKSIDGFLQYVNSRQYVGLESFRLCVGSISIFPASIWKYVVEVSETDFNNLDRPFLVPEKTCAFAIGNCIGVTSLSKLLTFSRLEKLRACQISQCRNMLYITLANENTLSTIKNLVLEHLPRLRALCKGITPDGTLSSLRILKVYGCHNLESLFSLRLLQSLKNLQEIEVSNCYLIEEIGAAEEENGEAFFDADILLDTITLRSLMKVLLSTLPKLKSIIGNTLICNSLIIVQVEDCPKLKKLPLSMDNVPPSLKKIEGEKRWWDELEWDNPNAKALFQPYFKETKIWWNKQIEEKSDHKEAAEKRYRLSDMPTRAKGENSHTDELDYTKIRGEQLSTSSTIVSSKKKEDEEQHEILYIGGMKLGGSSFTPSDHSQGQPNLSSLEECNEIFYDAFSCFH